MNCKEGDLAMIVNTSKGVADGMFVTCIRNIGEFTPHPGRIRWKPASDVWIVDREVEWNDGLKRDMVPDVNLIPIHKGDPDAIDVNQEEPLEVEV